MKAVNLMPREQQYGRRRGDIRPRPAEITRAERPASQPPAKIDRLPKLLAAE